MHVVAFALVTRSKGIHYSILITIFVCEWVYIYIYIYICGHEVGAPNSTKIRNKKQTEGRICNHGLNSEIPVKLIKYNTVGRMEDAPPPSTNEASWQKDCLVIIVGGRCNLWSKLTSTQQCRRDTIYSIFIWLNYDKT